jgi:hypothetical protein
VFNDFVAGTQRRLQINATAKKTEIQSGYLASINIDVPQMKVTQMKPGASGPGEVSASFTARGVTDPTERRRIVKEVCDEALGHGPQRPAAYDGIEAHAQRFSRMPADVAMLKQYIAARVT